MFMLGVVAVLLGTVFGLLTAPAFGRGARGRFNVDEATADPDAEGGGEGSSYRDRALPEFRTVIQTSENSAG